MKSLMNFGILLCRQSITAPAIFNFGLIYLGTKNLILIHISAAKYFFTPPKLKHSMLWNVSFYHEVTTFSFIWLRELRQIYSSTIRNFPKASVFPAALPYILSISSTGFLCCRHHTPIKYPDSRHTHVEGKNPSLVLSLFRFCTYRSFLSISETIIQLGDHARETI